MQHMYSTHTLMSPACGIHRRITFANIGREDARMWVHVAASSFVVVSAIELASRATRRLLALRAAQCLKEETTVGERSVLIEEILGTRPSGPRILEGEFTHHQTK
jgi:hypothetical protein